MRKSHLFLLIFTVLILIITLGQSHAFGDCGGSWFTTSCGSSPYANPDYNLNNGVDVAGKAIKGQITNKGIVEYSQQIIAYLMTFISIIAVIYIIYAGFQLMIGAGDEEKMKKTRGIILYVILGILIMWLAYPIVKWTISIISPTIAYEWSIVPGASAAYTESDADTFAEYKDKIKEAINQMESELLVNRSVKISTIQNVKNLIQLGFDRLPDFGDSASINREAKQVVDTYLDLAIKNSDNSNHVGNAISRVASFLDKANITRITGEINANPSEGNAPLTVSFRADGIKDPSGTTPGDNNYIWWIRENGGYRRELSRGPSLSYTFTKEGTYTVFLDVVSGSRNSKGKIDVLPLSVSKQIVVKPKLGEIILLINGVNVSNMNTLKISPSIGKIGVILDASASRAIGNGTIAETRWEFGNGNDSTNRGGPIVERQIYANQGGYIVKLIMKTNDGQTFTKELQLLVRDPAAIIKIDSETGNIGEEISMSATSYLADTKNIEYTWQIQDENGNKTVKTGEGMNFKHKFENVGQYIVSLTAKSPNGTTDSDSKVITIESRVPVVSIDIPRPPNSEKPNTISFDASKSYDPDTSSRKNLTYTWRIDGEKITLDNLESDGAKGTYTFAEKGTHTISVVVANVYGKITTVEKQFEVTSTLAVNLIISPKVVKRGNIVNIIGQSANAEIFEWNMGDGSALLNGTDRFIQHIYKQSGVYTVNLNVNRAAGAEMNSISRKIYVSDTESPFAIIDATNSSNSIIEEKGACDGNDALLINRADTTTFNSTNSVNIDGTQNGLSYTWKYFGKARTTSSISEKFNELGCFPIELTVRSNKNGASHTTIQYIKLTNQSPELTSVTNTIDSAKKDSQKVLVKVQANGAMDPDGVITSYIWYYTTESDPEPQNIQITQKNEITFVLPNITEKYFFGVILEDNDGAQMNSAESKQTQTPLIIDNSNGNIYLPLITLTAPKNIINVGEKVRFSVEVKTIIPGVNITNKSEYAWDFDGDGRIDKKSTIPNIEHTYTRSGDYNMKVRVTNNGVSNSKYQTIHVKNKLKANVYGYRLPDGRIYFLNASEGSYDKTKWEIGGTISESLSSILLDANTSTSNGKLTISSNDTDISTVDIDLSKLETISGSGLLYQSYPRSTEDVITVKNPSDSVMISMLGNTASNYGIDTDTMIDTSLDGTPDNDIDNKDHISYTDGSIYTFVDLAGSPKREHKIRLTLLKDGSIIATRNITIILDYLASTKEVNIDLTGSGTPGLSMGDRAKLEELSKLIRELTDSDRIILMQRYNTLVENWNNPFDKAKSLIDIQENIESGTMDADKKGKLSKVIDELLIGDAQITDEIGIAVRLTRDLIPKESPNHAILIAKLAEIESHPTLLEANKKLGREMLELIQNDTTIPDKYKVHIKDQLLVIINGGSASIPSDTSASGTTVSSGTGSGILGFISGFVKIFFIIIGIVLLVGIIGFIFYRFTRKGDNIGFQDFLIDSVFHTNKQTSKEDSPSKEKVFVNTNPPPKEDPLNSYRPPVTLQPEKSVIIQKNIELPVNPSLDPLTDHMKSQTDIAQVTPTTENVPDWLKVPTPTESPLKNQSVDSSTEIILPLEEIDTQLPILDTVPPKTLVADEGIPEWIKNAPPLSENKNTITPVIQNPDLPEAPTIVTPFEGEKLPDWLMSSIQPEIDTNIQESDITPNMPPVESKKGDNTKQESTKKTSKNTKTKTDQKEKETPSEDAGSIPSWLK